MKRNTLSWPTRLLVALAALATLLSLFFPLWHYYFEAPQYPEGLQMSIWAYRLGGQVDLINGLNHYVGFMQLDASNFVEFTLLPALIGLLALSGLTVAVVGSFRALRAWLIGFSVFGVVAFADFYRWLYQFGHTVDPLAIIDIEGYTPPMLGSSQFMNFYILSFPGVAFYVLIGALLIGLAAFVLAGGFRRQKATARAVGDRQVAS